MKASKEKQTSSRRSPCIQYIITDKSLPIIHPTGWAALNAKFLQINMLIILRNSPNLTHPSNLFQHVFFSFPDATLGPHMVGPESSGQGSGVEPIPRS